MPHIPAYRIQSLYRSTPSILHRNLLLPFQEKPRQDNGLDKEDTSVMDSDNDGENLLLLLNFQICILELLRYISPCSFCGVPNRIVSLI